MSYLKLFLALIMIICISCTSSMPDSEKSKIKKVKNVREVIVYSKEGRFAGWPANNGANMPWTFAEDQFLIGFTEAPYELQEGHNIGKPQKSWLARSTDGGETWIAWDPENYVGDFEKQPKLKSVNEPIDFTAPGFVMRVVGIGYHGAKDPRGHFFYSNDGGLSWEGPFGFGDLLNDPQIKKYGLGEITPRTDYVVTGENECLVFVSARPTDKFGTDRLFCIQTKDGGQSFKFLSWIVPPYKENETDASVKVPLYEDPELNPYATQCRAVMSSSLLLPSGKILATMRRKYTDGPAEDKNWVEAYISSDKGQTWVFLSEVGNTGARNGNPPGLNVTDDGRICAVFGNRANGTMQAVYSKDEGKSWSEPVIIWDNFWSEDMELGDLGYPRLMRRKDGKLVALFYCSNKDNLHHIHATIWDPLEN